jgi:hypothetical protein
MVLFLLSLIVAAILIAIQRIRNRIVIEGITRSEIVKGDFSVARERSDQSTVAGPGNQFLIVVLPDGTIVIPRVADRL